MEDRKSGPIYIYEVSGVKNRDNGKRQYLN